MNIVNKEKLTAGDKLFLILSAFDIIGVIVIFWSYFG